MTGYLASAKSSKFAVAVKPVIEQLEARQLLSAGPRQMEYLDRGVVATRSSSTAVFVSWRSLAQDSVGTAFNLYRLTSGGAVMKLNPSPLTGGTNFSDASANLTLPNSYFVKPLVNGVEQTASNAYTLAANSAVGPLIQIPLRNIGNYSIRHMSVADLDGDGKYDYIVDRMPPAVNEVATQSEVIEAYKSDGTFLWVIDCGPNSYDVDNIEPGSSAIDVGNWDGVTAYDLDGDGKSEVCYRSANGVVFGDGTRLSAPNNDLQYISVINGMTGAERARIQVPTDYLADGPMAASFGIGYLDGMRPSLVAKMKNRIGSGNFNMMFLAYDFNGAIAQKWKWLAPTLDSEYGHQIRIVDVDQNGTDEIADAAGVIVLNGDGTLRYNMHNGTPSVGHGDRFHIGDLDPDRPGLEGYGVQQNNPNFMTEYYYDAATGEILHAHYTTALTDNGRGQTGDIDPTQRGYEYWSFYGIYNSSTPVAGQPPVETKIADEPNRPWPNFRVWWDGDVLSENLNNTTIDKWNWTTQANNRLTTLYHYGSPTATSGEAPIFYGDIFGDWREEVIFENADHLALDIDTTQYASATRLYTLAQNPEYRNCMTVKGYYQSNMVDYYLGDGMSTPPTPNITVLNPGSNAAPTVATAASASQTVTTDRTVDLSVLGSDDGGESGLTYTWSATGPAAVTYSANGTNAAKNTVATFTRAGSYTFTATIRDAGGLTATSSVNVTANQTLSSVDVTPATATLNGSATQQFTVTGYDQFGQSLTAQPTFSWSVISGGGTISTGGLYTAPSTNGSATIQAAAGTLTDIAVVTVVNSGVPAAPSNLTASVTQRNKIKLTWRDNASNETGFHVWSSRDGVTWTLFTTLGASSGTGKTVQSTSINFASGSWYFRITSYNASGDSAWSNIASVVIA